jgi:hypothetical protein
MPANQGTTVYTQIFFFLNFSCSELSVIKFLANLEEDEGKICPATTGEYF